MLDFWSLKIGDWLLVYVSIFQQPMTNTHQFSVR